MYLNQCVERMEINRRILLQISNHSRLSNDTIHYTILFHDIK